MKKKAYEKIKYEITIIMGIIENYLKNKIKYYI